MTDSSASSSTVSPPRRKGKGCTIGAILLGCGGVIVLGIAAIAIVIGVVYWMWSTPPSYWQQNQAMRQSHSQQELAAIAESLEQRVLQQLSAVQTSRSSSSGVQHETAASDGDQPTAPATSEPQSVDQPSDTDEVRKIEMTFDEINAWISERLEDWLAHQSKEMPAQIQQPMVAAEDGKLVAAFLFQSGELSQVVSLVLDVQVLPMGQATLRVDEIRGGRLPIPVESMTSSLQNASSQENEAAEAIRQALEGHTFDPIVPIDNSREARLVDFSLEGDRVVLTLKVQPRR